MRPSTLALTLGATIRLTRFIVTDQLGEWLIHEPIDNARANYLARLVSSRVPMRDGLAFSQEFAETERSWSAGVGGPWWWRYREGLDCPYCVGYWVGVGVLAGSLATRNTRAETPWRVLLGTLSLNVAANAVAGLPGLDLYGLADHSDPDAEDEDESA